MNISSFNQPYPSRRYPKFAKNGMVATSQPLAAQAGLDMLKKGGNAIDAAVAAATCLTVVEPSSNGIGGDAFALVWTKGKLYGLNASGPAPSGISYQKIIDAGYSEIPCYGWIPVTIPGAPSAWNALSEKFGNLPFKRTIEPAVRYAEEGYPVSPVVSKIWNSTFKTYKKALKDEQFKYWFETFAPEGNTPYPGKIVRFKDHAKTLISIAESSTNSFYKGDIAEKIVDFSSKYGGYISKSDLENYKPEWVEPVGTNYRGIDIWEIPPNGHGLVALIALNILKGFEFKYKDSPHTYHKQIEALKLAYADGLKYIADPSFMKLKPEDLLSESYAGKRRKLIGSRALIPFPGKPEESGTVYLATADKYGNMVSYIQSNYKKFGSGLVVPGTGISLHNRGNNFKLDPRHDNCIAPGKKPYHTIIPGFMTKNGRPFGPFGVMGGFMQPQGHLQVLMNMIDFNLNPQAALDAPRWQWVRDKKVVLEQQFPEHIASSLDSMGHNMHFDFAFSTYFGKGQIIIRNNDGTLCGGTDPRADGTAASW